MHDETGRYMTDDEFEREVAQLRESIRRMEKFVYNQNFHPKDDGSHGPNGQIGESQDEYFGRTRRRR